MCIVSAIGDRPTHFLPRDAMHPRYILAMGLCPFVSVRLSQVGVLSKRLNESSWFWHVSILPSVLHCVKRKFGYLQK